MSTLKIFDDTNNQANEIVTDSDAIASKLHAIGVRFENWQSNAPLPPAPSDEDILAAYRGPVDQLMKDYGFQSVDVIALGPEHPDKEALRKKFLDEHTHSDFEVRFFVDGKGLFFIHANNHVYGVMCEKGDLISVPADTKHWFDMGEKPNFKCIRLFSSPEGWVANYTGDKIARTFPTFENF